MKILVLGKTGMLGHVVTKYLEEKKYNVYATNRREKGLLYFNPLEDIKKIENIINEIKPNIIINCIGILNKEAEENTSKAILINSYLPNYLDDLSKMYKFKLIHISTDCVFSGKTGNYTENSVKDAYTIYGQTKALGEINNNNNLTLRTSIIGPDFNPNAIGLFSWFMKQTHEINGYTNAIWTGLTTIELAKQIEQAIKHDLSGLYNVVNGKTISKYELLTLIKEEFNKDIIIHKDDSYVCDKSLIITRNDYIFNIPSYRDMIKEMHEWIKKYKDIYNMEV